MNRPTAYKNAVFKTFVMIKLQQALIILAAALVLLALPFCQSIPDETDNNGNNDNNENNGGILTKEEIEKIIAGGVVRYSDLGAVGDGKTDDLKAIVETHVFANLHNLNVRADDKATYYLGGKNNTVNIRTNTHFGNATFIIDDTNVGSRSAHVFSVNSEYGPFSIQGVQSLVKGQDKIHASPQRPCIVTVTNSHVKHYIRYGANQNDGSSQTDIFTVDKDGNVDKNTPILWNFDQITNITFQPIDETVLTITGGKFITIANQEESKYNYYNRGIQIKRSNVVVDGLEHVVTGEGASGAPYNGFLNINNCVDVTVRNTTLTGRKVYQTIGSAGSTVSMGSYDISVSQANNIRFENCKQTNDINNAAFWGIMGSNYCKNLLFDNCTFSRFDAHKGVYNATIRNSTLGHQGINSIGSGVFMLENSTVNSATLINLRSDYGSTWEGEFIIRNCVFVPRGTGAVNIIGGSNLGKHNFGYTCYMPEQITIENLHIDDSNRPDSYNGAAIFANFNRDMTDESYVEDFPYIKTKEVILENVTTESGKPLRISDNEFIFRNVKVIYQ
jgi:hypothetical protein